MQAARNAVSRLTRQNVQNIQKRMMSGGHSQEESIKEMNKWRVVTYLAIPACIALAVYDLSGSHEHHHDGPQYSYQNIRSKEFPWGECALFDSHCWKHKALEAASGEE